MKHNIRIGIIGYGRFGQLLKKDLNISLLSVIEDRNALINTDLAEYFNQHDVVFICVPISKFEEVIDCIAPYVGSTKLVDTLSVKCHPRDIAEKYGLLENVVLTHPMFGPQSAPNGCRGQRLVCCSVNMNMAVQFVLFDLLGLYRINATPEEHDEQVANSQVINHFVGRAARKVGMDQTKFPTLTHEKFMEIVQVVSGNSQELFEDMNKFNPYAAKARTRFINSLLMIDRELNE